MELDLIHKMTALMKENDAPMEQYARMGLPYDHDMTMEELKAQKAFVAANDAKVPVELDGADWTMEAKEQFLALAMYTGKDRLPGLMQEYFAQHPIARIDEAYMTRFACAVTPEAAHGPVLHVLGVVARRS